MNERSSVKRARTGARRIRAPDLRRGQILDAAAGAFAQSGFHATTMAEIADRAGVSVGLAYRYFSGKEELIEALVSQMRDLVLGWFDDAAASPDLLTALLRAGKPEALADQRYGNLYAEILAESARNPAVRAILAATDRALVARLHALMKEAQARGEVSPDADLEVLTHLLYALADGITVRAGAGLFAESWGRDARFRRGFEALLSGAWLRTPTATRKRAGRPRPPSRRRPPRKPDR